jgi:hypothetical protein
MIRALSGFGKPRLALLGATASLLVGWLLVKAVDDAPAILAAGITAAGGIMVGVIARRAAARAAGRCSAPGRGWADLRGDCPALLQPHATPLRGEAPGPRRTAAEPLSDREVEFADFMDEATQKCC